MSTFSRRLIEVDLPIRRISENAAAEMEKRRGHIPMVHIWWAHRPPVACRAVLLAALLPDPVSADCSNALRNKLARCVEKHWDVFGGSRVDLSEPLHLREALLEIVGLCSTYELTYNRDLLKTCRDLIAAAYGDRTPNLLDPFAGGGIIPFEGIRLNLETFASDLNPVSAFINKAVLEYIPRYGNRLADEVERWALILHDRLREKLACYYPAISAAEQPVAYIWARTIRCEGPRCGVEVPLVKQLWLSRKGSHTAALKLASARDRSKVIVAILQNPSASSIGKATVSKYAATCPCCNYTTPSASVKMQLRAQRGGSNNARMLAVVAAVSGQRGRRYRLPTERDLTANSEAASMLNVLNEELALPSEALPSKERHRAVGSQLPLYGFETWSDLFTSRQLLALGTLAKMIREAFEEIRSEVGDPDLARAIIAHLALLLDKMADMNTSLCVWQTHAGIPAHLFGRKALQMITDFAEAVPVGESSGSIVSGLRRTIRVLREYSNLKLEPAATLQTDAAELPLPDKSFSILFTDPPYYDSVPYADLSDFFYVWLKRSVGSHFPEIFGATLTDKIREATVSHPQSTSEKARYISLLGHAWNESRRVISADGIAIIVFAHKSTSAWEALLESILHAGWIITASWPVDTEMKSRMNAKQTASLASSVHLVCRPREHLHGSARVDEIGDLRDVLHELPRRIHEWMPRLADEGVVGADAIFACLGPALEIFSRYSQVEKASGETVALKDYLENVWAAVAKEALAQIFKGADATGFEEDARLTAMWLWTLSTGRNGDSGSKREESSEEEDEGVNEKGGHLAGFVLEYDAARKIAQGLGAHLESLTSLVEVKGDMARLLPVAERTRMLFGKDQDAGPRVRTTKKGGQLKLSFLAELEKTEEIAGLRPKDAPEKGATILDRIHQAMILFAAGRGETLRRFLLDDGVGRDGRFWKLADALSALYPAIADEKRWVDGVLARKKGLGL